MGLSPLGSSTKFRWYMPQSRRGCCCFQIWKDLISSKTEIVSINPLKTLKCLYIDSACQTIFWAENINLKVYFYTFLRLMDNEIKTSLAVPPKTSTFFYLSSEKNPKYLSTLYTPHSRKGLLFPKYGKISSVPKQKLYPLIPSKLLRFCT